LTDVALLRPEYALQVLDTKPTAPAQVTVRLALVAVRPESEVTLGIGLLRYGICQAAVPTAFADAAPDRPAYADAVLAVTGLTPGVYTLAVREADGSVYEVIGKEVTVRP
jgi:hypothetical protein